MMRWLPFAILAVLGIVAQTTIVPHLRIQHWIGPDWMFILAVYYALWGPWPDAAVAAWILGLIVDLFTAPSGGRIGLHALLYGAAAWGSIRARQVIVRDHPVAQFLITLVFALLIQVAVYLYQRWSASGPAAPGALGAALVSALYTAVCAPPLLWVLNRFGRLTGLRSETRPWTRRRSA